MHIWYVIQKLLESLGFSAAGRNQFYTVTVIVTTRIHYMQIAVDLDGRILLFCSLPA